MNRYARKERKRGLAVLLAAVVLLACASFPQAAYDDFDAITSHVSLPLLQQLSVTRPSGKTVTAASNYYLTGSSDPERELTLNGEPVSGRGVFGSWGAWVSLSPGENLFTLQNGETQQTVTIIQGTDTAVETTTVLTGQTPVYDVAVSAGEKAVFSCVAPAGAKVTVHIAGETVPLQQKAPAAEGVPASFTGEWTVPEGGGIEKLGQAEYLLSYQGGTASYTSAGSLYAVGSGETLLVQMKDVSSTVFKENSTSSSFVATAKQGAVDYVQKIEGNMYQLGMGGWVLQQNAQPLTDGSGYLNRVSDNWFEADEKSERFIFSGTGRPVFTAYQDGERLHIRFFHTSGIDEISAENSRLFDTVRVFSEDGNTTLDFMLSSGKTLWGYVVEYDENGHTILTCKYPPQLSEGAQPLSGITIALDAGHGGNDTGALGITAAEGATEKEITLATALAVEKRLQSLGATVVMTRREDTALSLSERQQIAQQAKADFFIALHGNAPAAGSNGLKPNGVEVYYYEDISASFAEMLLEKVVAQTGRTARWARYSNYKVTLNSYAPSVLLEMGFLQNPAEYDEMCSRRGIFNTANAIADSILARLR